VKFNELSVMVKRQRDHDNVASGESMVETNLRAWCRAEAGLPRLANGDGEDSQVVHNEVDGDDEEVEAMGECGIFEM
jgi:hypothetical protein